MKVRQNFAVLSFVFMTALLWNNLVGLAVGMATAVSRQWYY